MLDRLGSLCTVLAMETARLRGSLPASRAMTDPGREKLLRIQGCAAAAAELVWAEA